MPTIYDNDGGIRTNFNIRYTKTNQIVTTPKVIITVQKSLYELFAQFNKQTDNNSFEEYFINWYKSLQQMNRELIPVTWNNLSKSDIIELQKTIDSLDKSKKYFAVIPNKTTINFGNLDVWIFGNNGDIPIPFTQTNSVYTEPSKDKQYLLSYIGNDISIESANPKFNIKKKGKYSIDVVKDSKYYICTNKNNNLVDILSVGCVPVYVSDNFMIPFNKEFNYGVLVHINSIDNIESTLKAINTKQHKELVENGKQFFNQYCTYDSLSKEIIAYIKKME